MRLKNDTPPMLHLPPVQSATPATRGLVVELPEDLTLAQLREAFPADRFRLVYKPGGVIRIQRIERENVRARLINAGVAVIVRSGSIESSAGPTT